MLVVFVACAVGVVVFDCWASSSFTLLVLPLVPIFSTWGRKGCCCICCLRADANSDVSLECVAVVVVMVIVLFVDVVGGG